ncbi:hypothetical protein Thein_0759 [Thermodesulfatator indicus DSM 15286]|uniref:Uncharacterized protein n=1 Tax=Thermodesulfatator indicus (strain DSM 15286 / JCM 11887 / CIR29812) TaxID=667014 RepID=F8A8A4_THEID|nr:hypothetical protein [Thermodesulfatator indicus]AEH44637.1 hypothetical protein Thein_0759 [Thermodesulfatator indicus DSM 15286]
MKIYFDPDIPADIQEDIKQVVEEQIEGPCPSCGCDEIYVSLIGNTLDVKCYDCGESFFELELEVEEQQTA